jgi:selenide,water dikinase
MVWQEDERIIVSCRGNEDASVVRFPPGKAMVQTVDFFTPVVNDPFSFGRIAAANALSDIYAMGAEPYTAMNIVCFPGKGMDYSILKAILRGGLEAINEAGALMVGGHSVDDPEIKYGLSVTGLVDPEGYATNGGIAPGDRLLLTKPLGSGILATAVKADWPNKEDLESILLRWAGHLNANGGQVIRELGLTGATDVTGFGLGGHLLEMARASGRLIEIQASSIPVMEQAGELASMGLVPAGSHANKQYCQPMIDVEPGVEDLMVDIIFDAQTSGGLVLAVPEAKYERALAMLSDMGEMAADIGRVSGAVQGQAGLRIRA